MVDIVRYTHTSRAMSYCNPADHIWVQVVGGQGYDEGWDTKVCIKCECFSGTRITAE